MSHDLSLSLAADKSLDGAAQFLEYYLKEVGCLNKIIKNGNPPLLVLLQHCKRQTDRNEKTEDQIADIANFFMKNTTTKILDSDGNSPLHFAAESGLIQTIDVLLSSGADASRQNKHGRTALHTCLENPKSNIVEVVSKLAESGKASDQLETSSKTPLYLATSLCKHYYSLNTEMLKLQPRVVELLLQHGADPNCHNRCYIPLHSAVMIGDVDTVSLLLEKGALANAKNAKGQSAIHVLFSETIDRIKDCEMALLQLLLGKGTDVNATDEEGKSALIVAVKHYASREHRIRSIPCRSTDPSGYNVLAELICHGANVNLVDKNGDTALTMFCTNGSSIGIGMTLLKAGADPSVGKCLQSVLENYKLRDDHDFLLELLKKGANPNIHSGYGFINLIEVIQKEKTQLVEAFLRHGATVNCVHYNGKSALHYACDIAKPKIRNVIIPLLIKYGANLNLMSQDSMRPLDVLVDRMIRDISELQIINDGMYSHPYLKMDLSSFNQLIRSGSDLAPSVDKRKGYSGDFCGIRQIPGSTKPSLFLSLIQNGLFTAAYYLLQCGWEIEKDKCLDNFDITKLDLSTIKVKYEIYNRLDIKEAKTEFWNIFENSRKVTKPLSTLCRKSIRKQLVFLSCGSDITSKISKLPVPLKIQRFLDLTECVLDDEIILLEEKTRPPPRNPRAFNVMQSMYTGITAPSFFIFSNNGSDDNIY